MSLIAEFTIETPILAETLDAVPDMVLHTETIHMRSGRSSKSLVWAWGDDFRTFERSLDADPTVAEYGHIADVENRRLYRIVHTEATQETLTYPALAEQDAILLDTRGTHEGLEMRVRFPTRDALVAYREACRERDVPFDLRRLYPEDRVAGDGGRNDPYGLTDAQREALRCAMERGYFAVPRGTTLEAVADELGISVQAVSTRLRRGLENLLGSVLGR